MWDKTFKFLPPWKSHHFCINSAACWLQLCSLMSGFSFLVKKGQILWFFAKGYRKRRTQNKLGGFKQKFDNENRRTPWLFQNFPDLWGPWLQVFTSIKRKEKLEWTRDYFLCMARNELLLFQQTKLCWYGKLFSSINPFNSLEW